VSPYPGGKYPGLFVFFAVPLPGHTPAEMRDAIHKEIDKLKTADVSDEELAMYKTRTRADLLRGLADNQDWRTIWPSTRPALATGGSSSCNLTGWTR